MRWKMMKKYHFCKGKESLKQRGKKCIAVVSLLAANLMGTIPVLAGTAQQTQTSNTTNYNNLILFSGTRNLFAAGTGAVTALVAGMTAFHTAKGIAAMQNAQDEEKPKKKKEIITTLVLGVLGTCASGLVTWILAFYGASAS